MTDTETKIRIAPNSKESEMLVLGCMLTSINSLNIAADALVIQIFITQNISLFLVFLSSLIKVTNPLMSISSAKNSARKKNLKLLAARLT